ncbi:MAG: 8-oxo-dGTP diphosphatase [bacterium]|nr:8-oxo-dGTP diphosphatase [bacterium]
MKQLTLLFLIKDSSVLLAMKKRGFGVGRWNGVGGKLEQNETVEQAMIRECQEEICVIPTDYEKVAKIIFHEQYDQEIKELLVDVFVAKKWDGEPTETEEMRPEWFEFQKLPFETMWPDDKYWLPEVLEGKKIVTEFDLDKNDQITHKMVRQVRQL